MFSLQGPARTPHQNRQLAAYLAAIAGYVNTSGFLLVGSFTSHVTGNAAQLATDMVKQDVTAAGNAVSLVGAFFLGAFFANLMLQTRLIERRAFMYAALFAVEAGLLLTAMLLVQRDTGSATFRAAILCAAMGLQNSLMTLISDARVRTTHMTGVVTDLAIESARWVRTLMNAGGKHPPDRSTSWLLLSVLGGFLSGAMAGAESVTLFDERALWAPVVAALMASLFAARSHSVKSTM